MNSVPCPGASKVSTENLNYLGLVYGEIREELRPRGESSVARFTGGRSKLVGKIGNLYREHAPVQESCTLIGVAPE